MWVQVCTSTSMCVWVCHIQYNADRFSFNELLFITTFFGQGLVGLGLEILRIQCVYVQKKKVTEQQYNWHHMLLRTWCALAAKWESNFPRLRSWHRKNITDAALHNDFGYLPSPWCENCVSDSVGGWREGANKAPWAYGQELHVIWGHTNTGHMSASINPLPSVCLFSSHSSFRYSDLN